MTGEQEDSFGLLHITILIYKGGGWEDEGERVLRESEIDEKRWDDVAVFEYF